MQGRSKGNVEDLSLGRVEVVFVFPGMKALVSPCKLLHILVSAYFFSASTYLVLLSIMETQCNRTMIIVSGLT